jgi:hypothetical protein
VAPGLFAGLTTPHELADAVHYFNLQQFGLVSRELAQFRKNQTPDAGKKENRNPAELLTPANPKDDAKIVELMESRLAEYRKARVAELTELAGKDPFCAYQEAQMFIQDTRPCDEHVAAQALVKRLAEIPDVRKRIAEENAKAKLEPDSKHRSHGRATAGCRGSVFVQD